jgi:hypothetical protein
MKTHNHILTCREADLDFWAAIYCRHGLHRHRLPLSRFMRHPWRWLNHYAVKPGWRARARLALRRVTHRSHP